MAEILINSHKEFVELYRKGELTIGVDKQKAGDFVLSKFADPHNKPAHLFWSWTGVLLIPISLIVLFTGRVWQGIGLFALGLMVNSSSRKSAEEFVVRNMLEDPVFCDYVLLWKGAAVWNKNKDQIIGFIALDTKGGEVVEKAKTPRPTTYTPSNKYEHIRLFYKMLSVIKAKQSEHLSTSLIQLELSVGYLAAKSLFDELVASGVAIPPENAKGRLADPTTVNQDRVREILETRKIE